MKSNLPIIPRSASVFLIVLLLLLSPQSTVHAAKFPSSSNHSRKILNADHPDAAAPAVAFRPRRRGGGAVGSSASSPSTTSLAMRRRRTNPEDDPSRSFPATADAVRTVSSRRRRRRGGGGEKDAATTAREGPQPTLEELRAALGPAGLFAAGAMELAVVTFGSYVSGAFLGYVGGGIMGIPSTLFGGGASGGAMRRLSALHAKAAASCASWAALSASFSGFNNLVRLCRGGEDDGNWNAVIGSAMTGAFLNRAGGPEAMLRGGATYAGFTYVLDRFFKSPSSTSGGNSRRSSELAYTDVPVDEDDVAFF